MGGVSHRAAFVFSPALLGLGEEECLTRQERCSIKPHHGTVAGLGRSSGTEEKLLGKGTFQRKNEVDSSESNFFQLRRGSRDTTSLILLLIFKYLEWSNCTGTLSTPRSGSSQLHRIFC